MTRVEPSAMAPTTPPAPNRTSSETGPELSIEITILAPRAASAAVAATRTPASASASALDAVRFHAATAKPASASRRAMLPPMMPVPTKPIEVGTVLVIAAPPPARHSGAVSGGEAHLGLVDAEPLHRGLKTQEMRGL